MDREIHGPKFHLDEQVQRTTSAGVAPKQMSVSIAEVSHRIQETARQARGTDHVVGEVNASVQQHVLTSGEIMGTVAESSRSIDALSSAGALVGQASADIK
jgi:methyl-accepting chemotaxis protein